MRYTTDYYNQTDRNYTRKIYLQPKQNISLALYPKLADHHKSHWLNLREFPGRTGE